MREITKREQVTTYMKNKGLDIVCLQEPNIPSSSIEQRDEFSFVFASSTKTGTDYHRVGYRRRIEKYRHHYIQHTSHLAEIEINMHGNPLVIHSEYIPHDAVNADSRIAAWDGLSARIGEISNNKNVLVFGDYNAAIHARKEGEEEFLGPHVWGQGLRFLLNKERRLPGGMNRDHLIGLLRAHDMKCMNSFFQKPNHEKAMYRHVWTRGLQGPFTSDWYSEIDFCLAFRRWSNSVIDVKSDSNTNIDTDHLALIVEVRQKLKAIRSENTEITRKGARAETEAQEEEYNGRVVQGILHGEAEDMEGFMKTLAAAAEERFTLKPKRERKRDCHPELERIIRDRDAALQANNKDEVVIITKLLKRRARKIRTDDQIQKFKDADWDPVKWQKKGYTPDHTNLINEQGNAVNDRMRPDTFADYFEKVQWAPNEDLELELEVDQQLFEPEEPIHDTQVEVRQDSFTREELDVAIGKLKNNKAPGPNRVTPELVKLLGDEGRDRLLELINNCWDKEELFDEMNKAGLAVIYKKGPTEKPENYRPIALLNIGYKLMASTIQSRLANAMDDRIDPAQFGFRKKRNTAQPIHVYRRLQEMHEEARLELITILLDWEKAFDKIHQGKLLEALRRIGIPDKMVRVIESMYRAPRFSVKEKGKRSTERRQRTGIRQGCPLSPYLFITVMTVMLTDMEKGMTEGERNITTASQPMGAEGHDKFFYADGTLILASTAEAAELMFRKIQTESAKYNMRFNQRKCVF